jgi:hypothetical protein
MTMSIEIPSNCDNLGQGPLLIPLPELPPLPIPIPPGPPPPPPM